MDEQISSGNGHRHDNKKSGQFEQFVEKTVIPKEGEGTESGFFGTNSLESQKILGQTYKKQRKIKLSRIMTILWAAVVLIIIIGVASVFILNK